ncbi:MAG TPA: cold shock domain-containing protein, partial [Bacteroidales bacterium]|nr:cold shock domain-containing protein [Bacteroidales bacterium]
MGRARETFGKRENRTKQEKKRKDKEAKRAEKKEGRDGNNLDEMIAYVDEFGRITSTPPDLTKRVAVNAEDIQIGVPKYVEPGAGELLRTGVVAFFNESKGYGFINDALSGKSVFVHINGLTEPIKENNKVSFEVVDGPKG